MHLLSCEGVIMRHIHCRAHREPSALQEQRLHFSFRAQSGRVSVSRCAMLSLRYLKVKTRENTKDYHVPGDFTKPNSFLSRFRGAARAGRQWNMFA